MSAFAFASKCVNPLALLRAHTSMGASSSRNVSRRTSAARPVTTAASGHDVGKSDTAMPVAADPEIEVFQAHQANAQKLSFADECRTLVELGRYGVISTFSREHGGEYPSGSIVGFAADTAGRPIFAMSSMSGHTGDLKANGRCSLTVTAPGFKAGTASTLPYPSCPPHRVVCSIVRLLFFRVSLHSTKCHVTMAPSLRCVGASGWSPVCTASASGLAAQEPNHGNDAVDCVSPC